MKWKINKAGRECLKFKDVCDDVLEIEKETSGGVFFKINKGTNVYVPQRALEKLIKRLTEAL